jgi:hypothetical protein
MQRWCKIVSVFILLSKVSFAQNSLFPKTKPFLPGELLEYDVAYKWGLIYADAGWVNFSVDPRYAKLKLLT